MPVNNNKDEGLIEIINSGSPSQNLSNRKVSVTIKSQDGQTVLVRQKSLYEVLKVRTINGPFRAAVPRMPLPYAIVCCILNVVVPGLGTLFSAPTVFCFGSTEYESASIAFGYNLLAAFLQFISAIILVGYIWSLYWAVIFVAVSLGKAGSPEGMVDSGFVGFS